MQKFHVYLFIAALILITALCAGGCGSRGTQAGVAVNPGTSQVPGGSLHLAFTGRPYDTPAGSRISPEVKVAVLDSLNHTVTSAAPVITIRMATNPNR